MEYTYHYCATRRQPGGELRTEGLLYVDSQVTSFEKYTEMKETIKRLAKMKGSIDSFIVTSLTLVGTKEDED